MAWNGPTFQFPRWREIRVNEFRKLLFPCSLACNALGLFPYKTSAVPPYFTCSILRRVYATIVILLYCSFAVVTFYRVDFSASEGDVQEFIRYNYYFVFGGVLTVSTYVYTNRRLKLLQNFGAFCAKVPEASLCKLARFVYPKDFVGIGFLCAQFSIVYDENPLDLVVKAYGVYSACVMLLMSLMYMNCAIVLNVSFRHVNKRLRDIEKTIAGDDLHFANRIYHERKSPLLLAELKELGKCYNEISNLMDLFNEVFWLQALILVAVAFGEITFGLYFFILGLAGGSQEIVKQTWYSQFLMTICYHVLELALIIGICDCTKNEAKKTGTIVQNILVLAKDNQLREELQMISMQVIQRSNTFTAKVFTLDARLLASIVGNITTYLLILLQFLISLHPCGEQK